MPMKNAIRLQFARAVYRGRINAGLTQQCVADYLGRGKRWYQKIEAGIATPNPADAIRLMVLFDIRPIDLAKAAGLDTLVMNQ